MDKSRVNMLPRLLKFATPFTGILLLTIVLGTAGFLAAIGITVLGVVGILQLLPLTAETWFLPHLNVGAMLLVLAVSRGVLRYLEQWTGHYVAFKVLAFIRDQVFDALRRLAPAKLDGKDSGQLIALITADTELLEVFYAHTLGPVMIALATCSIILFIIFQASFWLALIALLAYLTIGVVIPVWTSGPAKSHGQAYREQVGDLNSYFLQSIRGMREVLQFNLEKARLTALEERTKAANRSAGKLRAHEGRTRALTEVAILAYGAVMLFAGAGLVMKGQLTFPNLLLALLCLMSSYGPVVALSNLSNNLLQTFASGERVLGLLEETPALEPIFDGEEVQDTEICVERVSFAYQQEKVLDQLSLDLEKNQIIGISGKSGAGKSTLLKLIMRFYDPQQGEILMGGRRLDRINTASLRETMAYVTQHTYLFHDTILENLRIANRKATMEEIVEACQKANIYDFILTLPDGFDSQVGELGQRLSGGERQRLGLARAFLHAGRIILLDEPTSNLDSLNECVILKALKEHSQDKTIILVSHRPSTMSIADKVYHFQELQSGLEVAEAAATV